MFWAVPTRQTSSSGRPKSPRIQVVLPEDLCQRLALLAEDESRTVSNMAKVLIQQGVERLERLRPQDVGSREVPAEGAGPLPPPPFPMPESGPTSAGLPAAAAVTPAATAPPAALPTTSAPSLPPPPAARPAGEGAESGPVPGSAAAADRFRAELERHEAQGPRRLRGVPRRLRLRPPGG